MAAYQIFVLFCVAVLFNTAESYKCYQCSSTTANDVCFKGSASLSTQNCAPLVGKCLVKQVHDIASNVTTITRECHLSLIAKTECSSKNNQHTCQMVCSDDKCNDVSSTNLETCAQNDKCKPETIHTGQKFQCYQCTTTQKTGHCIDAPGSSMPTENCRKGFSKCMTQSETRQGTLQKFTRSCQTDVLGLGAKDGCKVNSGVETCQVVCDNKNLCNSRERSEMEKCAKEGGCNTAALSGPTMFLFVCTATAVIKFFV